MPNLIDLTTVTAVNGILTQGPTVDSAVIAAFITNYSQSILTRTGRSYLSGIRSYSERYNGSGSETQALKNYPIRSVASLTVNGVTIPQSPDFIQSGWVIDETGSQAFLSLVGGNQGGGWGAGNDRWAPHANWGSYGNAPPLGQTPYRFAQGIQNVAVQYAAGYSNEIVGEAQTVPAGPGPYTIAASNPASFYQDNGVTLTDGTPLTPVTGSPGPLEYNAPVFGVAPWGVYTFNAAQASAAVLLNYEYGSPPYDLQEAAGRLVALQYRRRAWIGQNSQVQPGVGTTAYLQMEMDLMTSGIIDRYRNRMVV
jgi:hypothetical protein